MGKIVLVNDTGMSNSSDVTFSYLFANIFEHVGLLVDLHRLPVCWCSQDYTESIKALALSYYGYY